MRFIISNTTELVSHSMTLASLQMLLQDTDGGEQQGNASQGERYREAGHQGHANTDEQQNRHQLSHVSPPELAGDR